MPTSGTTAGRRTMNTQTSVLVARRAESATSSYANAASSAFDLSIFMCSLIDRCHHDAPKQEYGFIPQYHYWNSIDKARDLAEGIKKLCFNAAIQRGDQAVSISASTHQWSGVDSTCLLPES